MFLQCLVAIILIILIVDRWKPRRFVKLHQQLGNDWTYVPIFGHALKLIGNNEDRMMRMIELNLQVYQRQNRAATFWLGNKLVVIIADADQASFILKTALDKKYIHDFTKDYVGNGSVFAPVNVWRPRRKILVPTFAPRNVNQFVKVFEAQSKIAAEIFESRVGKGNFPCFDYFFSYSLDSICETVFGVNIKVQRHPDNVIFNVLKYGMKNIAARLCQPWLHIDVIYKMLPVYAQQTQLMKDGREFLDNLIYKAKEKIAENDGKKHASNNHNVRVDETDKISNSKDCNQYTQSSEKSRCNFKTFVELIVENSREGGKGLTHEEIREETIVLGVAGTDSSATASGFTMLLLAQHPDVQDKVYREIQEVLGDPDKPLQAEDLLKLKYTRAVIKESLRLYPSVPIITRHCEKDLELPSGLVLPRGTDVVISIWGIHRNPEHWGEDVNEFNPDRFMTGEIPNNAFMAFSYGPRNCIGQQYAMLSMTTTLVTMLRRYCFKPATYAKYDKNKLFRVSFDVILKHADNFTVQVEHRNKKKML